MNAAGKVGRRPSSSGSHKLRTTIRVTEPDIASSILRSRAWGVPDMLPFIDALERGGAGDLTILRTVARSSIIYQTGADHLQTRRALATFFSPAAVDQWSSHLDTIIATAVTRLASSSAPDIVRDFVHPLFLGCARDIFGLDIEDDAQFMRDLQSARTFTEPLLPLRGLLAIQRAFESLVQAVPGPAGLVAGQGPRTLAAALIEHHPEGVDYPTLVVSVTVAAHTAAETLAFAICGLLGEGRAVWQSAADAGWTERELENVIRKYPSSLTLFRVAQSDAPLPHCQVAPGDLAALDVPALNQSLCHKGGQGDRLRTMSFGDGLRKCPGAPFARLLLGRALPALARRFPDLDLIASGVRFERTEMVQAPVALPCRLGSEPVRRRARLWEITDPDLARTIATDDARFRPPAMEAHLIALQDASGTDLSTALRIARNAPFFLSGLRHARLRSLTFDVLGTNRLAEWAPLIDAQIAATLDALAVTKDPDLVRDFCDPLFRQICQPLLGIRPRDPALFDALAPTLQEVLEPLRSLPRILKMQTVFETLLNAFDPAAADTRSSNEPVSLLEKLELADDLDPIDRKAVVLVFYGASFNVAHTLANALAALDDAHSLGIDWCNPAQVAAHLDRTLIPAAASPRFIYRVASAEGAVGDFRFAAGDTMQLHLEQVNRDAGTGHLAFGHGLHRCIGAALSRVILRKAIPALLARFPDMVISPGPRTHAANSQTVILAALPVDLGQINPPFENKQ